MTATRLIIALSAGALLVIGCNDSNSGAPGGDAGSVNDARFGGDAGGSDAVLDIVIDTGTDTETDGPTRVDLGGLDTGTEDAEPDRPLPDPDPPTECGNGVRETGEICDGEQFLGGVDCSSQGSLGGEISCTDICTLNTDECYDSVCGDELVTGSEDCDGGVEEATDCAALEFAPGGEGSVLCGDGCAFDTSACLDAICGNENLEVGFEECDGAIFGDDSCRARGFFDGDLTCAEDCSATDDGSCVENVCGNGTVEGPEECDGPGSVALSCTDIDDIYIGGALGCADDCLTFGVDDCLLDEISPEADTDGDSVTDDVDNCIDDPNVNQLDYDADGIGNVCDEAVVFEVVLEVEGTNSFLTTLGGEIPLLGPVEFEIELSIEAATISVWFDDVGVMGADALLEFADAAAEIDLSGLGLPLPGVAIDVTGLTIESLERIITPGSTDGYSTGEMGGPNEPWPMHVTGAAGAAGTGAGDIDSESSSTGSESHHSKRDETYALTIDEPGLGLATISIELIIIPLDLDMTGLAGTVVVARAAGDE